MNTPDGKTLFAVAFNKKVRVRGRWGWVPGGIRYTHAVDAATARANVIKSEKCLLDIIGVAPAIGYFVNDNHGDKLSAS